MHKKKFLNTIKYFVESQQNIGFVLLFCAGFSLLLSNVPFSSNYAHFWEYSITETFTIHHSINDFLMSIFFFLVGLEVKREFSIGELSTPKTAAMPFIAALGGMLVPAGIFLVFNVNSSYASAFGIPMATDIAFALAVAYLLKDKVNNAFRLFLSSLAVIDDIGAVLVIAFFYTETIQSTYFLYAFGVLGVTYLINLKPSLYISILNILLFCLLWYFIYKSGLHATLAGILFAFALPNKTDNQRDYLLELEHVLHKPVSFIILPLFALSNTAFHLSFSGIESESILVVLGILGGLLIGKPLGIFLFCTVAKKMKWIDFPTAFSYKNLLSAGILSGIGFTMAIFIADLALGKNEILLNISKFTIMGSSLLSGILGYFLIRFQHKKNSPKR